MEMAKAHTVQKIILVLVVLGLVLLYAGSRIKVVEMGYEISRLKNENAMSKRQNGLLQSKVAKAKATSRLARWTKKLKMSPPGGEKILFLEE